MEREISIILKVRGAKAAKKAVQDVFDGQTKTLVEGFNKSTKKTGDNMKRVGRHSKSAGKSMNTFTKTLGRGMAALYLYNRAWNVFGQNFESGLQLERASEQFERHVGKVAEMLPVLRSSTHGIISDFDLLKTANRAFQQGIQPQQMGSAFKLATAAAQKLGLNASEAIKTITDAITTQNEGALKTLGVITNVNQAYQTQTALIAKNGGVMSKAMSIQLRQSLIMQELRRRFGGVNEAQEDGLMILERFKASWTNFRAVIGDTIGIALRPLTQVLTNVLDLTTSLLKRLNETGGFQKFVKIASTLAIVFGSMKFIAGARSLMNLFSFFGTSRGKGMPRMLAKTNVLMGKFGKVVSNKLPILGRFSASLTRILGLSASFARIIPGWGTAIAALVFLFKPLVAILSKAWTAGKVFFQLLSGFDENTGLSKVLRKDAEELGVFYNWIENAAKISLEFFAVLKGVGQGISDTFSPIGTVVSWAGDQLAAFGIDLFTVDKIAVRSTSRLDAITQSIRGLVKWLGLGASAIAMFIPGMQMIGLAGVAGFGGSLINDTGWQESVSGMMGGFSTPSPAAAGSAQPQTTMSTQQSAPEPRSTNLDYGNDVPEWAKTMIKELKGQTNIMETDLQKKDIEKSQNDARNNVWMRR